MRSMPYRDCRLSSTPGNEAKSNSMQPNSIVGRARDVDLIIDGFAVVDVATRPASGIFSKIHFPSNTIDVPRADTPLTGPRGHRTRISPLPRRNPRRATRPGGPTHRQPGRSCPGPDAPSKRGPAGRYTLSANESVCRPCGPADCVANKNRSMNAPANDLLALRAKAHGRRSTRGQSTRPVGRRLYC